jgi:hypothetical protein
MNAREIARAYGMPSKVAALIVKDPSQFKYWVRCGEEAYNGCVKWVDRRECCPECALCPRCCQARNVCGKLTAEPTDRLTELMAPAPVVAQAAIAAPVPNPTPKPAITPKEEDMPIPGKMEITIKIKQLPTEVQMTANGWKEFIVEVDGREISITVRPKMFAKLEHAQKSYPAWVAAIAGKMGKATEKGFILDEPNIQVFEKKQKAPEAQAADPATA